MDIGTVVGMLVCAVVAVALVAIVALGYWWDTMEYKRRHGSGEGEK